eukprot:gnl/TRDRNA2_/TRDRNA2_203226_c0_seq1.p1 gnl/TRDRNA2_/TRDRNA2_203226_c0~~gnl/TRDRNA2_/TRDRNA2_203226_c0_seq1.p1  ORF type:complete len:174 (-),score=31.85 gnl/TRDRNA2_/TRDRNA2_203226_c0_seq1:81-602(-)
MIRCVSLIVLLLNSLEVAHAKPPKAGQKMRGVFVFPRTQAVNSTFIDIPIELTFDTDTTGGWRDMRDTDTSHQPFVAEVSESTIYITDNETIFEGKFYPEGRIRGKASHAGDARAYFELYPVRSYKTGGNHSTAAAAQRISIPEESDEEYDEEDEDLEEGDVIEYDYDDEEDL